MTEKGWSFAEALGRDAAARYAEVLDGSGKKGLEVEIEQLRIAVERLAEAITR